MIKVTKNMMSDNEFHRMTYENNIQSYKKFMIFGGHNFIVNLEQINDVYHFTIIETDYKNINDLDIDFKNLCFKATSFSSDFCCLLEEYLHKKIEEYEQKQFEKFREKNFSNNNIVIDTSKFNDEQLHSLWLIMK